MYFVSVYGFIYFVYFFRNLVYNQSTQKGFLKKYDSLSTW